MTDDNQMRFNGWGDEVYAKPRVRGRPPFEWTEENACKVNMMLAMGWTNEDIAACIVDPRKGKPICVKTLQRHFSRELDARHQARKKLELKKIMVTSAEAFEKSNMTAMRQLDRLLEKNDRMNAAARLAKITEGDEGEAPSGKKAQKIAAGQRLARGDDQPTGKWGSDLRPGLGKPN